MYAEFTENLITGNEMIDAQHQELIEKINNLVRSCETAKEKTTAVKMLDYLADYTDFHFKEEEQLQIEIQYPGYDKHIEQHKEFIQAIEELHEMLEEEEGPSDAFVKALQKNVIEWLYKHIQGFDRSVAEFKFMRENNDRL